MKLPSLRDLTLLLALLGLLSACSGGASGEPQPPEIVYDQDVCDECGMLISEARFAAATITLDGQAHRFDDIGGMLLYHQARPEAQVRAWFVHDYESEAWLRAEAAFFVHSPQIYSPMGHGLAAFEVEGEAQVLAEQFGAEVLSFDEARAAVIKMDHSAHGAHN